MQTFASNEKQFDPFYKQKELEVAGDTYSLAFCSLLDPSQLEYYHSGKSARTGKDLSEEYLQPQIMTKQEYTDIFFSAIMVASLQIIVLCLIIHQMYSDDKFMLLDKTEFIVIVPRMISTVLMHMLVEPETRSGIAMMKYAVNHPHMFRGALDKQGNVRTAKVLPAFLLGFTQCVISILVEYVIVIFLCSMDSLISIFMKFAALTQVIKIDDILGGALLQTKMKNQKGKKLKT